MKPWRELVVPHNDVLRGTFKQSEFAADISAVQAGEASPEYQDPVAFFQRTYITDGMRQLLTQVAQRLAGKDGDPVIQLQTAFGGGKTHSMLAVYHMATRQCPLADLAGLSTVIDQAQILDLPRARVAVLDGTAHPPSQPWWHGRQEIRTLWGELAWQLGGAEGVAMVREADATGTSPGKLLLRDLLKRYAPCVVLVDELVAYVRNFDGSKPLSGGTYDSNISFAQSLTEAAKMVPTAIVLGSLPESDIEAGSERGVAALRALEKTFGRLQALWKPVASEEGFEIVRRRLFEPVRDPRARDAVCRAFADAYIAEGARFPSETQEARYYDRLVRAYPIHPEVFDRLYEDWSSIDGFQRTRGVLKLMAKAIHRLWSDDNKDLLILPGSLPLQDPPLRNELTYYLTAGSWDPVVERDIDGPRSETWELENREPRFGQVNAARRVARTLFLGTAPASVATKPGIRGLDRARVLLGCLQPGQSSAVYSDALDRLVDRLYYLNSSGDKVQSATRFWFDTKANLRREMEDRKRRFDDATEVREKIAEVLKGLVGRAPYFDGVHIFTPHADLPDTADLRLVVLPPEQCHSRHHEQPATAAVLDAVRNNGTRPRHRGNRLLFLAPEMEVLNRLRDAARVALAWRSIVDDVREARLTIDNLQQKQAESELRTAESVVPRAARECYKWLLCPGQPSPTDTKPTVEAFALGTGSGSVASEIERICEENELVISNWSQIHLRDRLKEIYWKDEKPAVGALTFWEDSQRYLYLPRLRNRGVLEQAIRTGAKSRDFFGIAYGQTGGKYEGFEFGTNSVQLNDTLLLIHPAAAEAYAAAQAAARVAPSPSSGTATPSGDRDGGTDPGPGPGLVDRHDRIQPGGTGPTDRLPPVRDTTQPNKEFIGGVEIRADGAKLKLVEVAEEIIAHLRSDPNAQIRISLEIHAEFPEGASDQIRRTVSENAAALGFKTRVWE